MPIDPNKVTRERRRAVLSQAAAATLARISPQRWSEIENGRRIEGIELRSAEAVALALGVSVDRISK